MDAKEKELRKNDKNVKAIEITTETENKPFVFISYKSDDWKEVLHEIVYKLQKKHGLRVYFDKAFDHNLTTWIEQFMKQMDAEDCVAVIPFLSDNYYCSYATLMEMMYTQTDRANCDSKITVVPVNIKETNDNLKTKDKDTGLGIPIAKGDENWKTELKEFDEIYLELRKKDIIEVNVYKVQEKINKIKSSTKERILLKKTACRRIMNDILNHLEYQRTDGSNMDICDSIVAKLRNKGIVDVFDERLIDPEINWSDFERTDKISFDKSENVISYNAVNHKTAGVNEITSMPSPSASANDLRSKLKEKLGGDEVKSKSKSVFWIKDDKKFRLRSTTSTINNNKSNEQYDYLICEIKGKYGVFSSKQESEKIVAKDLDLNFDGLIEKIKEKLEEESDNEPKREIDYITDNHKNVLDIQTITLPSPSLSSLPVYKFEDAYMTYDSEAVNKYRILKGSLIKSEPTTYRKISKKLMELYNTGVKTKKIVESPENPGKMILQEDLSFDSVSAAAKMVSGASENGNIRWKNRDTGIKFGEDSGTVRLPINFSSTTATKKENNIEEIDMNENRINSTDKIGKSVRLVMRNLSNKRYSFTEKQLIAMQSKEWSKTELGLNYSLLKPYVDEMDISEQIKEGTNNRYWSEIFEFNNYRFLVTSQWYERSREKFDKWIENPGKMILSCKDKENQDTTKQNPNGSFGSTSFGGITGPVDIKGSRPGETEKPIDGKYNFRDFLSIFNNKTFQSNSCKSIKLIGTNGCEKYSTGKHETARKMVFSFAMQRIDEMKMEYVNLVNSCETGKNPIFITVADHQARKRCVKKDCYKIVTSTAINGYSMFVNYSEYDWLKTSLLKQLNALQLSANDFYLEFEV